MWEKTEQVLHAKALACLFALQWSIDAILQRFTILADSQTLVEMLLHHDAGNRQILFTLKEIRRLDKTME